MKNFINKYKISISYITLLFIISFIFTVLEYLGLPYKLSTTIEWLINIILVFIYAYINGTKSNLKGYLSGFRSAVKIWLILLILNLITFNNFTFKFLAYYLIIMFISIIGGIIGKNKNSSS